MIKRDYKAIKERNRRIADLYSKGVSQKTLAEMFNLSRQRISDITLGVEVNLPTISGDYLEAVPMIPNRPKLWGIPYTSKCPCGGQITAVRSTLNGHMTAKCDKCKFLMME